MHTYQIYISHVTPDWNWTKTISDLSDTSRTLKFSNIAKYRSLNSKLVPRAAIDLCSSIIVDGRELKMRWINLPFNCEKHARSNSVGKCNTTICSQLMYISKKFAAALAYSICIGMYPYLLDRVNESQGGARYEQVIAADTPTSAKRDESRHVSFSNFVARPSNCPRTRAKTFTYDDITYTGTNNAINSSTDRLCVTWCTSRNEQPDRRTSWPFGCHGCTESVKRGTKLRSVGS